MPSCLGHWWVPAWTPTGHQCPHNGKAVDGCTHEHMTPEHATDTNEPKTDTRSYKHGFGDPCAVFFAVLHSCIFQIFHVSALLHFLRL